MILKITPRTRINLWWSTAPALVGYPQYPGQQYAKKEDLLAQPPDFRGTPRQVAAEMERIRRETGGCFIAWFLRDSRGRAVDLGDPRQA